MRIAPGVLRADTYASIHVWRTAWFVATVIDVIAPFMSVLTFVRWILSAPMSDEQEGQQHIRKIGRYYNVPPIRAEPVLRN